MRDRRRETRVRFTTRPLHKARIFRGPVTIRRCRFGRTSRGVARRRQDDLRLDSTRVVVVRAYALRERACEEIERRYCSSSFPRKRESACAFPQEKPRRYCGRPPPDSRFRACEEIEKLYKHSSFPRKRESIAAFPQGKPGRYSGRPPPDSRFRGNDEVLFDGYCLLQFRYLGDPSVTMRDFQFLHTLFRGNGEEQWGGGGPIFDRAFPGARSCRPDLRADAAKGQGRRINSTPTSGRLAARRRSAR